MEKPMISNNIMKIQALKTLHFQGTAIGDKFIGDDGSTHIETKKATTRFCGMVRII